MWVSKPRTPLSSFVVARRSSVVICDSWFVIGGRSSVGMRRSSLVVLPWLRSSSVVARQPLVVIMRRSSSAIVDVHDLDLPLHPPVMMMIIPTDLRLLLGVIVGGPGDHALPLPAWLRMRLPLFAYRLRVRTLARVPPPIAADPRRCQPICPRGATPTREVETLQRPRFNGRRPNA